MKIVYGILLSIMLCGCSGIQKHEAVKSAIRNNLISGLNASDQFQTTPWSFPSTDMGPYSDIAGFSGTKTNDPNHYQYFVFFVGKLKSTKKWEVFSAMTWTNGTWKLIQVELSE